MYCVSEKKLKSAYISNGYSSIRHFASSTGIHRNAVHAFLRGKEIFSKPFLKMTKALGCDPLSIIAHRDSFENGISIPSEIMGIAQGVADFQKSLCAFLFGSRAEKGDHSRFADWDVGVASAFSGLTSREHLRLRNKVEEMAENLPWKIDLINFDNAPAWFLKEMRGRPKYLAGSRLAWLRLLEKWEAICGKSET